MRHWNELETADCDYCEDLKEQVQVLTRDRQVLLTRLGLTEYDWKIERESLSNALKVWR